MYPADRRIVLALVAFVGGLFLTALVGGVVLSLGGYDLSVPATLGSDAGRAAMQVAQGVPLDDLRAPAVIVALLNRPLWIGLVAVPLLDRRRGLDWRRDLGWTVRPVDLPLGLAIGVTTQFALVPFYELVWLFVDRRDVGAAAEALAATVDGPVDVVAFVAMTVIAAPVAEEIVYRGLLYRAIRDLRPWRSGVVVSVILSSLLFAMSHFQVVQFAGLFVFGAVAAVLFERTGRLATPIFAHVGFNAVTVVVLLS